MTKILIVEDEPDIARMASRLLRMRGFEVILAADGEAGVAMAAQHRPDVILMDLILAGGIDGSEAARRIKSAAATRSVPIIMLSASSLASLQAEAFRAGANDAETKPVDFDRLTGKIRALLAGRGDGTAAP